MVPLPSSFQPPSVHTHNKKTLPSRDEGSKVIVSCRHGLSLMQMGREGGKSRSGSIDHLDGNGHSISSSSSPGVAGIKSPKLSGLGSLGRASLVVVVVVVINVGGGICSPNSRVAPLLLLLLLMPHSPSLQNSHTQMDKAQSDGRGGDSLASIISILTILFSGAPRLVMQSSP